MSNDPIENSAPKAYGIEGAIVIDAEQPLQVRIYSLSGSLIKQVYVDAGKQIIPQPKGLYIITFGDLSYKLLVR